MTARIDGPADGGVVIENKISKHVARKFGTQHYQIPACNGLDMYAVSLGKLGITRLQRYEAEALYLGLQSALAARKAP